MAISETAVPVALTPLQSLGRRANEIGMLCHSVGKPGLSEKINHSGISYLHNRMNNSVNMNIMHPG
jgi:hypothetical protein